MTRPVATAPGLSERPATGLPLRARWVLAAYPTWWRERYGEDQASFLEDLAGEGRPLRRALVNLALGAIGARLRTTGMPRSVGAWRDRTRASIAWATVPAFAGLVLLNVIEQHSFRNSIGGSAPLPPPLSTAGHIAADAMTGIQWAAMATLLLLLTGWALVAGFAGRVPKGPARRRWRLLTCAPLGAGVVAIGLQILRNKLTPVFFGSSTTVVHGHAYTTYSYRPGGHPLAASAVSVAYDAVSVLAVLSILGVVLAARRADLRVSDLRGGVRLAQMSAVVMVVSALASVAWGLGVTHQPPRLNGLGALAQSWTGIQTSIAAEWPLLSAGLVAVSIVTAWGALSARRSYRETQELTALDL